jgi:hypothetical protein
MRVSLPPALIALALYAAASLAHHVHNAEFLDHYPAMPAWLTRAGVYLFWLGATAIGVLGYWLGNRALLAIYGLYGIGVLAHYALAPLSAHTPAMHFTIGLEAATAVALLIAVLQRRPGRIGAGAAPRRR